MTSSLIRLTIAAALALEACATSPARQTGTPWSQPALALCPGTSIANAPAADGYRRILAYTPTMRVRGIVIARAPAPGCVSSAFGPRIGGAGAFHEGLDLYTGGAREVSAGASGRITGAGARRGYGLTVEIDHGAGVATRYAHLSDIAPGVRDGARVEAGAEIGRTGNSGNATAIHLHYEVLVDRRPIDPLAAGN